MKKGDIQFRDEDVGQIDISNRGAREFNEEKFVEAVKNFQPTVLVLAFCFGQKSELNDLLRAAGIYSTIVLREKLAQITESRHFRLDKGQEELIRRIAEEKPKSVFLWGSSGTGKSLILAEALKMRISQLRREGVQDIRVIVSTMKGSDLLLKDLREKYLPDIARENFITLRELAKKNNAMVDEGLDNDFSQAMIKKLLSSLSAKHSSSSSKTILVVDEVEPSPADWSSFTCFEGVDFLLALSTFSSGGFKFFNVIPPNDKKVLCQRLSTPHRNCKQIGTFLKFYIQHGDDTYLSGANEDKEAFYLPPGRLPVWIQRSQEVTHIQVLEFVKENHVADSKLGVTVLQCSSRPEVENWCNKHNWRCVVHREIVGSEDQCIVTLDGGAPSGGSTRETEQISRGRNLLVIVTERKSREDRCKKFQLIEY